MNKTDGKYSTIHYQQYLELDKILGAQNLRSAKRKICIVTAFFHETREKYEIGV